MPPVEEPTTALGNWYGTALFWRPLVALLVNEQTLYPVLMPLAPAATLMGRFPGALRPTLGAHGVAEEFIEAETAEMMDGRYMKTANRSVLGIMNEFSYLAEAYLRVGEWISCLSRSGCRRRHVALCTNVTAPRP